VACGWSVAAPVPSLRFSLPEFLNDGLVDDGSLAILGEAVDAGRGKQTASSLSHIDRKIDFGFEEAQ